MATKTISIDIEAYRRLAKARQNGESFSEIIKRVVPEPFDLDAWLKRVREAGLSEDTVEAVEQHVATRRQRSRRRR
jgi:predicted CopG family antitoxin